MLLLKNTNGAIIQKHSFEIIPSYAPEQCAKNVGIQRGLLGTNCWNHNQLLFTSTRAHAPLTRSLRRKGEGEKQKANKQYETYQQNKYYQKQSIWKREERARDKLNKYKYFNVF